jgi:predicted RNase H-like HicB family nuclease
MSDAMLALTAVYMKAKHGYVGFIEEMPGVTSHGQTLDQARSTLVELVSIAFDEERRSVEEMVGARDVLREPFYVPLAPTLRR